MVSALYRDKAYRPTGGGDRPSAFLDRKAPGNSTTNNTTTTTTGANNTTRRALQVWSDAAGR
jgi:hypothetical protein